MLLLINMLLSCCETKLRAQRWRPVSHSTRVTWLQIQCWYRRMHAKMLAEKLRRERRPKRPDPVRDVSALPPRLSCWLNWTKH